MTGVRQGSECAGLRQTTYIVDTNTSLCPIMKSLIALQGESLTGPGSQPPPGSSWDSCPPSEAKPKLLSRMDTQQLSPETGPHPHPLVLLVCSGHMPGGQCVKV